MLEGILLYSSHCGMAHLLSDIVFTICLKFLLNITKLSRLNIKTFYLCFLNLRVDNTTDYRPTKIDFRDQRTFSNSNVLWPDL